MKTIIEINNKIYLISLVLLMSILFSSCKMENEKSDAYGNFELDKTIVSAESNGKILWLKIEEGMHLKANEIIGQIDTMNFHLQKQQLFANQNLVLASLPNIEANLNVQEQQKKNILVQQKRVNKLFKKKAATQKQVDDVQGSFDLIKAQIAATNVKRNSIYEQVKVIDTQVDLLNYQIEKCKIISPIVGEILNQFGRTGEMAAGGKPLFSIASPQDIRLKVYVSGDMLAHIKIGQKVDVLIDETKDENKIMEGEITWIASEAEFTPKTVQTKEERVNLVYAVKIRVAHKGELKAGMPGEMNLK